MSMLEHNQHTIIDFARQQNIAIDKLYIDRFWSSLYDDRWVYIDTEIICWLGYAPDKIKDGRAYVLKKLRSEFQNNIDFRLISLEDVNECEHISHIDLDTITVNSLLIVEPDAFKKLLLSMPNSKASRIQDYFITVERLCRKYMQYQLTDNYKTNRMSLDINEVVYIVSNNRYSKMSLYKIGKTKNLKSRLSSLNTSNPDRIDDRLKALLVIKTYDGDSMEKMIHAHLDKYRHSDSKEWFKIHFNKLIRVVQHFQKVAQESIDVINDLDRYSTNDINQIALLSEPITISHDKQLFICPHCTKKYKSEGFYRKHIQFCK